MIIDESLWQKNGKFAVLMAFFLCATRRVQYKKQKNANISPLVEEKIRCFHDLCALLRCGHIRLYHVTHCVIDYWFANQVLLLSFRAFFFKSLMGALL